MTSDAVRSRRLNLSHPPGRLVRVASLAGLAALAACATPPAGAPAHADGPAARPPSAQPTPTPAARPAPPAPPPVMLTAQEVQKAVLASIEYLEAGQEELAAAELQKVVQTDPGNRLAQSLMKQIHDDPVAMFGAASFSYRVPAGESLSRIAQRFLNDPLLFYGLARYNNIKVPRTLGAGDMLRIPGRAPAAAATQPSPPREAPAPAAAPVAAPPPPSPAAAASPGPGQAAPSALDPATAPETAAAKSARLAKQKSEAVARHTRSARGAFAKQDLQGALAGWDAVLAVEPDNRTALLERQKVLSLMDKLGKVK